MELHSLSNMRQILFVIREMGGMPGLYEVYAEQPVLGLFRSPFEGRASPGVPRAAPLRPSSEDLQQEEFSQLAGYKVSYVGAGKHVLIEDKYAPWLRIRELPSLSMGPIPDGAVVEFIEEGNPALKSCRAPKGSKSRPVLLSIHWIAHRQRRDRVMDTDTHQ